jgi:hypothetical protein
MPVTHRKIGTGMTERISTSISGPPWGDEEMRAIQRMVEAQISISTFEGRAARVERWCQQVLVAENLPPWDTVVRVHADGRRWTDDLPAHVRQWVLTGGVPIPDDVRRYLQALDSGGEHINTGKGLAYTLYPEHSEVWFVCEILTTIDFARQVRADHAEESMLCKVLDLGGLIATAALKFRWEPDALLGKRFRERRPEGNQNSAVTRGAVKDDRQRKVREAADAFWKQDLTLTNKDVISMLRRDKKFDELLREVGDDSLRKDLRKPEEWSTVKSHKKSNP